MNGIYNIAIQSLMAYEAALTTTSQNISNVDTPYYARKQVNFADSLYSGGVNVADIERIYDQTASQNVLASNSVYANMNTLLTQLKGFEPFLDQDTNSVGKYINDSLNALQQLNADTSSIQGRLNYMTALTNLSNQFGSVNNQIQVQLNNVNQALITYADDASDILTNIAVLNKELLNLPEGADSSQILDQREQQAQQLATYVNFTSGIDAQGNLNLSLTNGLPLVSGTTASAFSTAKDAANPGNLDMTLVTGSTTIPISNFIANGEAAAQVTFRNTLTNAQCALGRLALCMSQSLNQQNKLGIDYNGNLGGDIFNDINSASMMGTRIMNNANNTGSENMSVNINNVSTLTTSNYQLQFDTATHYILTRLSDNTVVSSGAVGTLPQAVSADGFTLNINSGTIAAGDQFVVSPTNNAIPNMTLAITDPKLLALGQPVVVSPNLQNTGSGIIQLTAITDTTNASFATPKQLTPPITISFLTATSYQLVNAKTGTVIEGPIAYNPSAGANVFPTPGGYNPGYQVSLTGIVAAGDTFNIGYNQNSLGDNRNALLMTALYQQNIMEGGTLTFIQGYHMLSSDVSIQASSTQIQYNSAQALQEQAMENYNQTSAVSLEEETINLASYQQAYQASAQILQAAKTIFESVIAMVRS